MKDALIAIFVSLQWIVLSYLLVLFATTKSFALKVLKKIIFPVTIFLAVFYITFVKWLSLLDISQFVSVVSLGLIISLLSGILYSFAVTAFFHKEHLTILLKTALVGERHWLITVEVINNGFISTSINLELFFDDKSVAKFKPHHPPYVPQHQQDNTLLSSGQQQIYWIQTTAQPLMEAMVGGRENFTNQKPYCGSIPIPENCINWPVLKQEAIALINKRSLRLMVKTSRDMDGTMIDSRITKDLIHCFFEGRESPCYSKPIDYE